MKELKGITVSQGFAIGKIFLFPNQTIELKDVFISEDDVDKEIAKVKAGIAQSVVDLKVIKEKASKNLSKADAEVFDGHIAIVTDPELFNTIVTLIQKKHLSAANAVDVAVKQNVADIESLKDKYMSERSADLKDIGKRLLRHILGIPIISLATIEEEVVLVAEELLPSDTAVMNPEKILGLVTERGGNTSHAAIMARAMEIPAIVGVKDALTTLKTGEMVILESAKEVVICDPSPTMIDEYVKKEALFKKHKQELLLSAKAEAVTTDGTKVHIFANIGNADESEKAISYGAEGVGLFRSEFLFMDSETMPSENAQFQAYKSVLDQFSHSEVVLRTLDVGGDKPLPYFAFPEEENPFLGWRAIRMCFDSPDIFRTQLRAILRASVFGDLRILLPMIVCVEEVIKAKALIEELKAELKSKNIAFNADIKIGVMIETPASALIVDRLSGFVDFFSIGTNDLIQYTVAVDRGNEKVANLYSFYHLSVLRLIKTIIELAHQSGKKVAMCGEMASIPALTPVLLGLGLDEFSMTGALIPEIKSIIRKISMKEAGEMTDKVFQMNQADEIETFLKKSLETFYER